MSMRISRVLQKCRTHNTAVALGSLNKPENFHKQVSVNKKKKTKNRNNDKGCLLYVEIVFFSTGYIILIA